MQVWWSRHSWKVLKSAASSVHFWRSKNSLIDVCHSNMRANVVLRESQWTSEWYSSTAAHRLENSRVCKETYSASKSPLEPHLWPVRLGHFLIQPWLLRRRYTVQHILPMKCHFLWRKRQSLWRFQHSLRVQEAYKTKIPPAFHFDPQSAQTAEAARPLKHQLIHPAVKQMHLPISASLTVAPSHPMPSCQCGEQWLCPTGEEFSVYWCQNNSHTLFHTSVAEGNIKSSPSVHGYFFWAIRRATWKEHFKASSPTLADFLINVCWPQRDLRQGSKYSTGLSF